MSVLDAIILGIVEGVTEYLPISSTGHLLLTQDLMGMATSEFLKTFDIAIQSGAILAVVLLYGKTLLVDRAVLIRVMAAFVPTAILGFLLYKIVKTYLHTSVPLVLWSLLLGGIVLVLFEWLHGEKKDAINEVKKISLLQAALIGVFQAFAFVPGVSRSAATVVGGMALGISRRAMVEFSFLLAIPTMCAATAYDLLKSADQFSADQWTSLSLGFVAAFLVAILAIRFLLRFVQSNTFAAFGWYRILVGAVGLLLLSRR